MIDLLELERNRQAGLVDVQNLKEFENTLPKKRGYYEISKRGKPKYNISQEAIFDNILQYARSSALSLATDTAQVQGNGYGFRYITSPDGLKELEEKRLKLEEESKFYKEEVRKYRDLMDLEIGRETSTSQKIATSMITHMARQSSDMSQLPLLAASSYIGGAAGGAVTKVGTNFFKAETAKRVGSFIGRGVGEGLEEVIDEYTVDGKIDLFQVGTAAAGGGLLGEIPTVTKFVARKAGLIKTPKVNTPDIKTDTQKLKAETENSVMQKAAETKSDTRGAVDELADVAESIETKGEKLGKTIPASETFKKSITIEGVTLDEASNVYLPEIASYIIDKKLIKGVVDEDTFIEAINTNGKSVKETFRKLGRRKDLPDSLKNAVDWYNKILDEKLIKSVEVDGTKVYDNSIGVLENPSQPRFWKIPEDDIETQISTAMSEREANLSVISEYVINNKAIKGIETEEDFIKGISENSRAIKKFFRNIERRKDLPDDVRQAVEWYRRPELEAKKAEILKAKGENYSQPTESSEAQTQEYNRNLESSNAGQGNYGRTEANTAPNAPQTQTANINTSVQIDSKYPFTHDTVDKATFEEKIKNRVKHNPRDFNKKSLEKDLRKDLKIPKDAKVELVNGAIPKERVPIITGTDYDGNSVTGRSTWRRDTPQADISWNYKGHNFYSKVEFIDGKWRGDIYETNPKVEPIIKKAISQKEKEILGPYSNPYDAYYGTYKPDESTKEVTEDFLNYFRKLFGLDKKRINAVPGEQRAIQMRITKEFGRAVLRDYRFKTLEEAALYYKKKYDLDFEFVRGDLGKDRIGEVRRVTSPDGEIIRTQLILNTKIDDFETAIGVLRHEIEHLNDLKYNPEFKSRNYTWLAPESVDVTIGDFFNKSMGGHFSKDNGTYYELNYIIHKEINNLFSGGKIDRGGIERLGLDMIPEKLDTDDMNVIKKAIELSKVEEDAAKRLARLKKELTNDFQLKKGISQAAKTGSSIRRATAIKEFLKTNILLPFDKINNQMMTYFEKPFEIEVGGVKYNQKELFKLFRENEFDFGKWCFYNFTNEELPEMFKPIEKELNKIKDIYINSIKELVSGTELTPMDIINAVNYDSKLNIMNLIPDEEVTKYMTNGIFDWDKFWTGTEIFDSDINGNIPERALTYINKFADLYSDFFRSADYRLKHHLKKEIINPKDVIPLLAEARGCMTLDEFTNLLRKHHAETIPEIRDYLSKHQELFQPTETLFGKTPEDMIQENIVKSKKKAAKNFIIRDSESNKGENNPTWGTVLHRFGRFLEIKNDGLMSSTDVTEFVKLNRVTPEYAFRKLELDMSSAFAMKAVMPTGGYNGLKRILSEVEDNMRDSNKKTYFKSAKRYIEMEIGYKLGVLTDAPQGTLDKVIKNGLSWFAKTNLMGPKFVREFLYEPGVMNEAAIAMYGGPSIWGVYKDMTKSFGFLIGAGENIGKEMGDLYKSKWIKSVANDAYNYMGRDLDDFTGYYEMMRAKYGTNTDKLLHKLSTGLEKLNWYEYSQRIMKLAANFTAGNILEKQLNFNTLDELFKNNTHWVKRVYRDIGITDTDFKIMKKFLDTESFKERGLFDEIQLENAITQKELSEILGRELTIDEFKVLRDQTVKKMSTLNERIVSDISPTETTGAYRAYIETVDDPILRNFLRLTTFFKTSIQKVWERKMKAYYEVNIDPDTNKFDFSNVVYQKRMLRVLSNKAMLLGAVAAVTDAEFYEDPFEYISDKVDEMFEHPLSPVMGAIIDDLNFWGLTTGSAAVSRPINIANQMAKGKWDKAGENILKMTVNTYNYNMGKKAYKYLFD